MASGRRISQSPKPVWIWIGSASSAAQQAQRAAAAPSRLCHELLAVRLAQHLGCEVEELPAARDRASQDWPRYCQELLAAANLTGLVLDPGWDPTAATASAESLATLTGCAVRPIWRLEPLVDRLIEAGAGATEILSTVEQAVRDAPQQGYRGLKTIAAYRTGLAIDPAATLAEAAASLTVPAAGPVRRRGKALRDLLVRLCGWFFWPDEMSFQLAGIVCLFRQILFEVFHVDQGHRRRFAVLLAALQI